MSDGVPDYGCSEAASNRAGICSVREQHGVRVCDPGLHLTVNGVRVAGHRLAPDTYVFCIRTPASNVRLMSHASRPMDLSLSKDRRFLGVCVIGLQVVQGDAVRDIPVGSDSLVEGFHRPEAGWRWTNGNALLPASIFAELTGEVQVVVSAKSLPRYLVPDRAAHLDAAILGGFESLGVDCEFGFVQRASRVEPTSLLRWSGASLAMLRDGLSSSFDGLGEPDHTELYWSETSLEYKLRDRRYLTAHTNVKLEIADRDEREQLRLRGAARLRLLRRKLLDDIRNAHRIFVIASGKPGFDQGEMHDFHALLRVIGPASLFCVRVASPGEPVGYVVPLADTLFSGSLDRLAGEQGPDELWRSMCRQVHALAGVGHALRGEIRGTGSGNPATPIAAIEAPRTGPQPA